MTEDRQLALLRIHQRSAPLDARERLAAIASALPASPDILGVSTCHRVELYGSVPAGQEPERWFAARLDGSTATGGDLLEPAEVVVGRAAVEHLFRVTAGLDSTIKGEGQILGQVRRTYEDARAGMRVDPLLAALFQRAIHVARELRARTPLGEVRRSIGSLAVDAALGLVADPGSARALVVGAGEIGKLAARSLARRVGTLVIANRDRERAEQVASLVRARAVGLDDLPAEIALADVVISAADTRGTVLDRRLLEARCAIRPLVLVDIAVPRGVAEDARSLPGLIYRDVDDLGTDAATLPAKVVEAAERRCADEAAAFVRERRSRRAAQTIRELHQHAEAVRQRVLARSIAKLGHLPERDREVVGALSAALTNALIHEPTVALRAEPEREDEARALFRLDAP